MNTFLKIKTFFEFSYKICKTGTFWRCEQIRKRGTFLEFVNKKNVHFLKLADHFLNRWTKLKNMNYYWICGQIWKAGPFFNSQTFFEFINKTWKIKQHWICEKRMQIIFNFTKKFSKHKHILIFFEQNLETWTIF